MSATRSETSPTTLELIKSMVESVSRISSTPPLVLRRFRVDLLQVDRVLKDLIHDIERNGR